MNQNIERRGRRSDPKPYETLPIMKINPIASKQSSQGWYSKSSLRSFGDSPETAGRSETPGANPCATQERTKLPHAQRHQPLLPPCSPSSGSSSVTPSPTACGEFVTETPSSYYFPDRVMGQVTPTDVRRSSPNFQLHSQDCPLSAIPDSTGMLYPNPGANSEMQGSPINFWHCDDSSSREAVFAYSNLMHTDGLNLSTHNYLQPGTHEHVTYQYSQAYSHELGVSAPYAPSETVARSSATAGQWFNDIHYPAMAAPSDYGSMSSAYKNHSSSMNLSGGNCTNPYAPTMDGMLFNASSEPYFDFMTPNHTRHDGYSPHF